jgi:hypothetical protein
MPTRRLQRPQGPRSPFPLATGAQTSQREVDRLIRGFTGAQPAGQEIARLQGLNDDGLTPEQREALRPRPRATLTPPPFREPALRPAPTTFPGPQGPSGIQTILQMLQNPQMQEMLQGFLAQPQQRRLSLPPLASPPPFGQFRGPQPGLFGG